MTQRPHAVRRFAPPLLRRREGSVLITFGLMVVPLILCGGLALDYGRAYMANKSLQGIADSAALAGAIVFTDQSQQQVATTTAANYFAAGLSSLPPMQVSTPVITTAPAQVCASGQSNTITVTATATMANTLLSLISPSTTLSVTATAAYPLTILNINVSGDDFLGIAGDLDGIYWYPVPTDGSAHPPVSQLNLVATNLGSGLPDNGLIQACIGSTSQRIGFALMNSPGARLPGSPTSNTYGGSAPNTYYYYSTDFPPAIEAYPSWPYDSALQIVDVNSDGSYPAPQTGIMSPSYPVTGDPGTPAVGYGYFPANAEPLAADVSNGYLSCAGLKGGAIHIYWNDMGAGTATMPYFDNFNYTDAELGIQCDPTQPQAPFLQH